MIFGIIEEDSKFIIQYNWFLYKSIIKKKKS